MKITILPDNTLSIEESLTEEQKQPLPGRDKWIAALRSGEYKQGRVLLCGHEGYCCLGVLSRIQGRLTEGGEDGPTGAVGCLDRSNPLTWAIGLLGNLPNNLTVSSEKGAFRTLAALNDAGVPFTTIADLMEACWSDAPDTFTAAK